MSVIFLNATVAAVVAGIVLGLARGSLFDGDGRQKFAHTVTWATIYALLVAVIALAGQFGWILFHSSGW